MLYRPRSLTRCDEETNTASNGNRILATSVTELSRLITCGSEPALKTFFYLKFILVVTVMVKVD